MDTVSAQPTVSALFLDALTRRDFEQLGAQFDPLPRARLLTPSALAMPAEASGVADRFRQWFGEADVFEVAWAEVSAVGRCVSIRYRLRLREHGQWYVCEQQAYCRLRDGLIERIDLLCSGFQPSAAPVEERRR